MKEVPLPVEAATLIPHHPEVRVRRAAPHTLLPVGVHHPADLLGGSSSSSSSGRSSGGRR